MKPTLENIRPPQGSSFKCLDINENAFDSTYHYHPEIEITWINRSQGTRLIGDNIEPFGPGDLVLIGSEVPHQYRNLKTGVAQAKVIQFERKMLSNDLLNLPEFKIIRHLLEEATRGFRFSQSTTDDAKSAIESLFNPEDDIGRLIRLFELLRILGQDRRRRPIASPAYQVPVKLKKIERLQRILNYLEKRYAHPVALREAARVAVLHPQSLSRFFSQHLGMSFQEYLIRLRLSHAARQLLETNLSITEIAFACGFNNIGNFNRHFRKYFGYAPKAYRQSH